MPTQFEAGFLVGLLVGEGHFGGDGRQPHVTLRMHTRHEAMFQWLERTFPGGRLYGPYHHGGRDYFQWMARGPFLRDELVPILDRHLSPDVDRHTYDRYQLMKANYPQLTAGSGESAVPKGPEKPAALKGTVDYKAPAGSLTSPLVRPAETVSGLEELFSQLRETWPT